MRKRQSTKKSSRSKKLSAAGNDLGPIQDFNMRGTIDLSEESKEKIDLNLSEKDKSLQS